MRFASLPIKIICHVTAGQSAPQGERNYCNNGTPFIKAGNLEYLVSGGDEYSIQQVSKEVAKNHGLKIAKAGSVVFAKSGISSLKGYVYTLKHDCYVVSHLAILTPINCDSEYLNLCLQIFKPSSLVKDAAFPSIALKDIKNMILPIPSPESQKEFVKKVKSEVQQIDLLRARFASSLKQTRALFFNEINKSFEKKPSWVPRSMEQLCHITSSLVDPQEEQYLDLLHIGGANIVSQIGELRDLLTAQEEKLISGKYLFDETMVVYSKLRPHLMKVARPDFRGLCSADMYPLKPKSCITKDFLYYLLLSKDFTTYAIEGSARAGMPKVNRDYLFKYETFVPQSIDEQKVIAEHLDKIREQCIQIENNFSLAIKYCELLKTARLKEEFES